jgi:ornithine cyclodeaminase/alanine dehydrogenase-like protein (mu-crystallin family)
MSILVLTASDVARVEASWPSQEIQSVIAHVFFTLSHNHARSPHRTTIDTESHRVLFMPARIDGIGTSIKVVSVPLLSDDVRGLPASTLILDENTGAVRALVNARSLTALRTAAGMSSTSLTVLIPERDPPPQDPFWRRWFCIHRRVANSSV